MLRRARSNSLRLSPGPAHPARMTAARNRSRRSLTQPQPPLQVVNVRAALLKGRMVEDFLVEGHVGLDSFDDHLGERVLHARDRGLAAFPVRNDLPHKGVVVGRNVVSRVDVTIDADARPPWRMPQSD